MAWLWLVSVGVSDVQFPAWKLDEYGQWSELRRFEIGRGGCRAVHEDLLALLQQDLIAFPEGLPAALSREEARDLRLVLDEDQGTFLVSLKGPHSLGTHYQISSDGNEIPNPREPRLPLFCPKAGELLGVARDTFGADPVTLVVLNTRRNPSLPDGRDEPIASGPLVTKFLAERLGLDWVDGRGAIPDAITAGVATWVDILTGDEAMEDPDAQGKVVRRITNLIKCWMTGGERKIAVTTSGGMPPLKPIIERVPATCLGQEAIRLLDRPERGPAKVTALNYSERVAEREILRFHCVEALRQGDYASAYGLARRALGQPWATAIRDGLGWLLEMPGRPLDHTELPLDAYAICACQIETRLCMGDVAGALVRIGTFIDSTIWALIARDARIIELGLTPIREDGCLQGQGLQSDHPLVTTRLLERNSKGPNRHGIVGLTWRWPGWLADRAGGQSTGGQAINNLRLAYDSGNVRNFRNLLVHGAEESVDLNVVRRSMQDAGMIAAVRHKFGENFLSAVKPTSVLSALGSPDLNVLIDAKLQELLDRVIEE